MLHSKSILRFDKPHPPIHPTEKPVELMKYLINTFTNENDLVLDNTMGAGATCVAAQALNRNFIGIEKRKNFFNLSSERVNFRPFQMYDGKKFTLRNTGYYSLTVGGRGLMHRYVWEKEKGKIPDGWDIHHKDEIKANNEIENLECLPKPEHTKRYSPHNNQYTKGRKRETHRTI